MALTPGDFPITKWFNLPGLVRYRFYKYKPVSPVNLSINNSTYVSQVNFHDPQNGTVLGLTNCG